MFKSTFAGIMPFEDNDILADSHYIGNFPAHPSNDGVCSSCNNTNICQYDPLDMSKPIRMPVDGDTFLSTGNDNVCEYDPLDISSPIDTPIDDPV